MKTTATHSVKFKKGDCFISESEIGSITRYMLITGPEEENYIGALQVVFCRGSVSSIFKLDHTIDRDPGIWTMISRPYFDAELKRASDMISKEYLKKE